MDLSKVGLSGPIPRLEEVGIPITSAIPEGPGDIIPGLLPRQGQLVIAGETNVGKSLVALEICSSLITGIPLWGALEPALRARRILYVLGEHYNEVIQRLWQVTQLPMTDQVFLVGPEQVGYDKWLVTGGRPNPAAVSKFRVWAEGCDLIVFDPFSAFVTGIDVENDNATMRLVLDTMNLVAQGAGASCLILAHQGKPFIGKNGREQKRKTYAIRGASAIEDAATNIFYMGTWEPENPSDASERMPPGRAFELRLRKYKGIAPPKYVLLRDETTLTHTIAGGKPAKELERIVLEAKVGRIKRAYPANTWEDACRMVASADNLSEDTVRRALKLGNG